MVFKLSDTPYPPAVCSHVHGQGHVFERYSMLFGIVHSVDCMTTAGIP